MRYLVVVPHYTDTLKANAVTGYKRVSRPRLVKGKLSVRLYDIFNFEDSQSRDVIYREYMHARGCTTRCGPPVKNYIRVIRGRV